MTIGLPALRRADIHAAASGVAGEIYIAYDSTVEYLIVQNFCC